MVKAFIKNYYKLFDEIINNWTIIVLLIIAIVIWVSYLSKEQRTKNTLSSTNIVEIDWVKYKVVADE